MARDDRNLAFDRGPEDIARCVDDVDLHTHGGAGQADRLRAGAAVQLFTHAISALHTSASAVAHALLTPLDARRAGVGPAAGLTLSRMRQN